LLEELGNDDDGEDTEEIADVYVIYDASARTWK
jgi:hypothetical protein